MASERHTTGNEQFNRREAMLHKFRQRDRSRQDFRGRPTGRLTNRVAGLREATPVVCVGSHKASLDGQLQPIALESRCVALVAINPREHRRPNFGLFVGGLLEECE